MIQMYTVVTLFLIGAVQVQVNQKLKITSSKLWAGGIQTATVVILEPVNLQ